MLNVCVLYKSQLYKEVLQKQTPSLCLEPISHTLAVAVKRVFRLLLVILHHAQQKFRRMTLQMIVMHICISKQHFKCYANKELDIQSS